MNNNYIDRVNPEKSWSISRMKTLDNCAREYYYTYYKSHNGWKWTSDDECKLAWRLKKLTNLWMYFGEVLHTQIKGIIEQCKKKEPKFMKADRFNEIALNILRQLVKDSKEKYNTNQWNDYPSGNMLQEYYYGGEISKETGIELKDRLIQCINSFYISQTFEDILNTRAIIVENDEDVFSYFKYEGLKIYSKLDLLYIDEKGYYIIVDWKTGRYSDADKEQLLVYAWYVNEKYNIPFTRIKGRIEYLLEGYNEEVIIQYENIEYIKSRVINDLKIINYYLKDTENNEAKEKIEFEKTELKYKCTKCNFRLLCNGECV